MTSATPETLDQLRLRLASKVAENAAFDGWSARTLTATAQQAGVDADILALAFDGGAMAMIDAWFASIDEAMQATFAPDVLAGMNIRARITALVEARLALMARQREALRRAQSVMAMPQNIAQAARLGWRSADAIWRAAGDGAADFSHYTKRATLSAIYAATLLVFVNDESKGWVDTKAFLGRRIDDIMRFGKAKARLAERAEMRFDPARFLGRLRYRA